MASPTYFQIGSTVTVGSGGASSIDFTSIPSTYTDLVLKMSLRHPAGLDVQFVKFNGSTSGYTYKLIRGSGSAAASFNDSTWGTSALFANYASNDTNTFSNTELYIPNYAGSAYKSVSVDGVQEANATTAYMSLVAGLWSNTAAITSISISLTNPIGEYSTASLYGIKKD